MFAAGKTSTSAAAQLYVDDVFSTYLYTGNGSTQTITNGIALGTGFAEQVVNASITSLNVSNCPIAVNGANILIAIGSNDVRYSTNSGSSFTTNSTAPNLYSLLWFATGSRWVGAGVGGLYESTTPASSFNSRYSMSTARCVREINGYLYAGKGGSATDAAIVRSSDAINWSAVYNPSTNYFDCADIVYNGSVIVSVGSDATSPYSPIAYYSSDGASWSSSSTSGVTGGFRSACVIGTTIFAMSQDSGGTSRIYSTTSGTSWTLVNTFSSVAYDGFFTDGSNLFITSTGSRKYSANLGVSFTDYSSSYRYAYVVGTSVWSPTSSGLLSAVLSSFTQGKGGLVWIKDRSAANPPWLYDTNRGTSSGLQTSNTNAAFAVSTAVTAFNSNGFALGANGNSNTNTNNYVSWTFREAPKFFDVVTYTGDGVAGRQIAHSLGTAPGMIIVKCTNIARDWAVWHRTLADTTYLKLNTTDSVITNNTFNVFGDASGQTSSVFTVGKAGSSGVNGLTNANGDTYVAYLFAHDTATDGIIQCGSFTTDGSGNATVNLGWEPQWVLIKSSSATNNWIIGDNMRGAPASGGGSALAPNLGNLEFTSTTAHPYLTTATGFTYDINCYGAATPPATYIYVAIRRPNKPPTTGTQVFSPIASSAATGTALTTNFPVDLQIAAFTAFPADKAVFDRLRGISTNTTEAGQLLITNSTAAEAPDTGTRYWGNTGFQMPSGRAGNNDIFWNFRRAPGVFDEVCYTGTGVAQTLSHSLGAIPELMIAKTRSGAGSWQVYTATLGATKYLILNDTLSEATSSARWNDTAPTATQFTVGTALSGSSVTHVAYLFATSPGISKVFSYTGNGSSQTINCGFSTGARFVLIKRTDSTGNWLVVDTARGLVSAGDPTLYLNSTAAEVTGVDWIDPDSSGFIVNQEATMNANVSSATYIGLAFA